MPGERAYLITDAPAVPGGGCGAGTDAGTVQPRPPGRKPRPYPYREKPAAAVVTATAGPVDPAAAAATDLVTVVTAQQPVADPPATGVADPPAILVIDPAASPVADPPAAIALADPPAAIAVADPPDDPLANWPGTWITPGPDGQDQANGTAGPAASADVGWRGYHGRHRLGTPDLWYCRGDPTVRLRLATHTLTSHESATGPPDLTHTIIAVGVVLLAAATLVSGWFVAAGAAAFAAMIRD